MSPQETSTKKPKEKSSKTTTKEDWVEVPIRKNLRKTKHKPELCGHIEI